MLQELVLKTGNFYNFIEEFQLAGESYNFHFYYNARGGFWSLDLYPERSKEVSDVIVGGLQLMANKNLLEGLGHVQGIPSGELWCVDTTGNLDYAPVSRDNLGYGKKYTLWYRS